MSPAAMRNGAAVALLYALVSSAAAAAFNEPNCGTKTAAHPDNIVVKGGKVVGAKQGIVGGTDAMPNSWPWQVFLTTWHPGVGMSGCGATVLNKKWLLTAAHCVDDAQSADVTDAAWLQQQASNLFYIIAGLHERMKMSDANIRPRQSCKAAKVVIHPKWAGRIKTRVGKAWMAHDIALIKLNCELEWTDEVRPACLPEATDTFYDPSEKVVLTGFGDMGDDRSDPTYLQQIVVGVHGERYDGVHFDVALGPHGACKGDSGGPANALRNGKWVVAGVTSFGETGSDGKICDSVDSTSAYTHVPTYVGWIKQHITDMS